MEQNEMISTDATTQINTVIESDSKKLDIFFNTNDFEEAQRKAKMIAHSNFTPERFKGNIGDCVIALDIAQRLQMSPITILQEVYIVHGSPAFTSKFIIALINFRGGYAHDLEFEQTKDSCYAWTTNKQGRKLKGPMVTLEMARKEGWIDKKGSKWLTMPDVMLGYRAASFFAKKFCPGLLMGMQSLEEIYDMTMYVEKDITPPKASINEQIKPEPSPDQSRNQKLRDAIQKGPNNDTSK